MRARPAAPGCWRGSREGFRIGAPELEVVIVTSDLLHPQSALAP